MPSPFPEPISEMVVQNVEEALATVPDFTVEREQKGGNPRSRHGLCVVMVGDPIPEFANGPCMFDEYVLPIGINIQAIESERSGVTVGQRLYGFAALARRALMADIHRGGFAVLTEFEESDKLFTQASPASVLVTVKVRYRTPYGDPYSL